MVKLKAMMLEVVVELFVIHFVRGNTSTKPFAAAKQ